MLEKVTGDFIRLDYSDAITLINGRAAHRVGRRPGAEDEAMIVSDFIARCS